MYGFVVGMMMIRYCSRFYPNVDVDKWSCEWCIHEEEQRSIKRRKAFECLLDIAQSIPDNLSSPPPPPVQPSEEKHQPLPQYTQGAREKKRAASETKNVGGGGGGGGGGKALERWKSLASRGRFGCRRYKLLADVLC